jgi:polyhydroxybutyrate depolymerase
MGKIIAELLLAAFLVLLGLVIYFMAFDVENPPKVMAQSPAGRVDYAGQPPKEEKTAVTDDREHFVTHDGRKRRYLVHVPKGHDGKKALPVVLAFHGGMGRAETQRTQSGLNDVADREGFLVVYPDGTGLTRLLTFNSGGVNGYAMRNRVDDVGFVRTLIDKELPSNYAIDKRRVYATGMSNGAMMTYRLACELSDRIAAIAPVAGDMAVDGPQPKRPVPVIHFHGLKDPNVMFEGGVGRNAFQPMPHRSIPETIDWWVKADRCAAEPVEKKREKDYTMTRYEPKKGAEGAPVVLYVMPEGGHTWPGGVDLTAHLGTGKLVQSVDASKLMWEFFKQHSLPEAAAARK